MDELTKIINRFDIEGDVLKVEPLGSGLINDTYRVTTVSEYNPDYVLQRINHKVFTDVDALQANIEAVTHHIRRKLQVDGADDIDRRTLRFIAVTDTGKTYLCDGHSYWRMMVYIPDTVTMQAVTPDTARQAGQAFGQFQAMLADLTTPLAETIPDFHNMEYRLQQLREAVAADPVGRLAQVQPIVDDIERRAATMCQAEEWHRRGLLPKRICHCDTKVNNMLYDRDGKVLCVIDLDTVMPSYIYSDYGDFLRTGACTTPEDEPDVAKIDFDMSVFRAFTEGYLQEARSFLTPLEIESLPYAAALFPYMQAVRFLADYINGDTYYKINYPDHNLVRTRAQMRLLERVEQLTPAMTEYIASIS